MAASLRFPLQDGTGQSNSASDSRIWSALRSGSHYPSESCRPNPHAGGFKEGSLFLLLDFDSIAAAPSQLRGNLDSAIRVNPHSPARSKNERYHLVFLVFLKGARDLEKPSKTSELFHDEDDEENDTNLKNGASECCRNQEEDERPRMNLKHAKKLAVSMAKQAASIAGDLRSMKSVLCSVQDRCAWLDEENGRLRDRFCNGFQPEDDDLARLQLETLLGEKLRLANENANLTRENHFPKQLVEYHQQASQDPSPPFYQQLGMRLDFSSPSSTPKTPQASVLGLSSCLHDWGGT